MRRFDHGSGGVTVLVFEDLRSKEVKKSKFAVGVCGGG
jgi:hypothetical protein